MDQVHVIRHKVLLEGNSVRSVAKEMGISRNTVAKYLNYPEPTRRVARKQKRAPVMEMVAPRIEEILSEWTERTSHMQRITGTRIHRQLVEGGYEVGICGSSFMAPDVFGKGLRMALRPCRPTLVPRCPCSGLLLPRRLTTRGESYRTRKRSEEGLQMAPKMPMVLHCCAGWPGWLNFKTLVCSISQRCEQQASFGEEGPMLQKLTSKPRAVPRTTRSLGVRRHRSASPIPSLALSIKYLKMWSTLWQSERAVRKHVHRRRFFD
jgi:predicted transcriptional regulator